MFQLLPLDPNTVFIVSFWGNLLICILIFSYSFSYATMGNKKVLNGFGLAKLLLTVGWGLIFLKNFLPDFISINIANTIILSACLYETITMLTSFRIKTSERYQLQIAIIIIASIIFNAAIVLEAIMNTCVLIILIGFLLLIKEKQDLKIQKLLDDKNIFFAIIAHDLRGPLGSSVALSKLLIEDIKKGNHGEIREAVEVLHQSNKNVYKLLDDLLEWSRTQTGMMEYSPEKITLNELINENIELNQNAALNKNIELLFEATEQIEVEVDKNMIDTIVRNLLTNAIKFTGKNGKIGVRVQKKHQNAEISITDNGIGIPDLIKEKLFKINGKVIQRGTDNEIGNGIGLLLCSEFINRHQGKIWAESELGKGSTFKFSVPLEAIKN